MELSVKADFKQVEAMFKRFPEQVKAAAVAALNKTAMQTKTAMYRRIRQRRTATTISASELKSRLHVRRASAYRLVAGVQISGAAIPLNRFKHRITKSGVFADDLGSGLKGPVIKYGNKAFTNRGIGNGIPIFVRTGPDRFPIEKLFGPSLPSAITAHGWSEAVLKVEMAKTWARVFANQLQYRLRRYMR